MANIGSAISKLLEQARDAGATPEQINNLRQGFKMQYDWSATKKKVTPTRRKQRRLEQKAARRRNRGKNKGISNRKGQVRK